MHEMAKAKGRKFERVVASAGNMENVGEIPLSEETVSKIQVQVNPMTHNSSKNGIDGQVRHSLTLSSANDVTSNPLDSRGDHYQKQMTSVHRSKPSNQATMIEDSMISAASSVNADATVMNSVPQID